MTTTELLYIMVGYLLGQLTLLAWVSWKDWRRRRRGINNDCFRKMAELTVTKEGIAHLRKYLKKINGTSENRGGG